jgi:ABC-2 type transport system permease protein
MMRNLIANELFKLRTSRAPWLILGAQLGLITLGMSGMAVAGLDFKSPGAARLLLCHAGMSSLLVLVIGIMAVAGEYRDGTITDTFLSTPRRSRVLAAKLVAYTGLGLVYGILSATTALIVAALWFASKGVAFDPAAAQVWQTLVGVALWMPLYAAIGVALGALVRNLGTAIAVSLAWIALVEGIAMNLLGDLGRWLPMASGMALDNVPQGNLLPQVTGGLVLVAYAVLFAVLANLVTMRSDVA